MNSQDKRLWELMIMSVHEYLDGRIDLARMIHQLQSSLDASELISVNPTLVEQWYEFFVPLEVSLAIFSEEPESFDTQALGKAVLDMEAFLRERLQQL